jgi:nitrate reductase beta subunit
MGLGAELGVLYNRTAIAAKDASQDVLESVGLKPTKNSVGLMVGLLGYFALSNRFVIPIGVRCEVKSPLTVQGWAGLSIRL